MNAKGGTIIKPIPRSITSFIVLSTIKRGKKYPHKFLKVGKYEKLWWVFWV